MQPRVPSSVRIQASRGPDAKWPRARTRTNYLKRPEYRGHSIPKLLGADEEKCRKQLEDLRWGEGRQVCPECGGVGQHYWSPAFKRYKCRHKACGKQFTVFSGTRVHGLRLGAANFLSMLAHFVEAKDSISARELAGQHDLNTQTAHVVGLKIREAIAASMLAEGPLTGYVQADAAYFMKYRRPGNVGTGASFAAKADQKNAGLDESGKVKQTVSKNMHALVVFVQAAQAGKRRYKVAVTKTENAVDLLNFGQRFCDKNAWLVTDQHNAYNLYSGAFDEHTRVNHSVEFMNEDGFHTNLAENFFGRMRSAQSGAWHRMSLQYLELYGWEFAWRQTMLERSNAEQLADLAHRVLNTGRSERFADYWGKRDEPKVKPDVDDRGLAIEIDKGGLRKKRGRKRIGHVVPQAAAPRSS